MGNVSSRNKRLSEEQNNESEKQKVPHSVLNSDICRSRGCFHERSANCLLCVYSGFGGAREAEAGQRHQDEEERISDEGAGETEEATR